MARTPLISARQRNDCAISLRGRAPGALFALILMVACGGPTDVKLAPVGAVSIAPATASLEVGESGTLVAALTDAKGATLSGRVITWKTSNPTVADVDAGGRVTGVADGGPIAITATSEGKSAAAQVTVRIAAVAAVVLTPAAASVAQDTTVQLAAVVRDARGVALSGRSIAWATSEARLATVSNAGLVTGIAPGGPVTITATVESKSATTQITVTPPPVATVAVTPASLSISIGTTATLAAVVRDKKNTVLTGRQVTWSSSNIAIVSVSAAGVVTAVAAGGPVRIEATSEGKTASATVTVVAGFTVVATGRSHSCGIISGDAFCWGGNEVGQLGDGSAQDRLVASMVTGGLKFVSLSLAHFGACGITTSGAAYCWGDGAWGQRGDGTTVRPQTTPIAVVGGYSFRALASGGDYFNFAPLFVLDDAHVCGITTTGAALCWGANRWGELGRGTTFRSSSVPAPVTGAPTLASIAAGAFHNCGLTAGGDAYCWGYNAQGQLGRPGGTGAYSTTATLVPGGLRFASLALGDSHSCGLTAAGEAYCWGYNIYGQIGDGTKVDKSTPTRVLGGIAFRQIAAGEDFTCGVSVSGEAWCWGDNSAGRLGDGSAVDSPVPVRVAGGLSLVTLASHDFHSCAIATGGRTYCWGANGRGQLGDGGTSNATTPVQVVLPSASSAVASRRAPSPRRQDSCATVEERLGRAWTPAVTIASSGACSAKEMRRVDGAVIRARVESPDASGVRRKQY